MSRMWFCKYYVMGLLLCNQSTNPGEPPAAVVVSKASLG